MFSIFIQDILGYLDHKTKLEFEKTSLYTFILFRLGIIDSFDNNSENILQVHMLLQPKYRNLKKLILSHTLFTIYNNIQITDNQMRFTH